MKNNKIRLLLILSVLVILVGCSEKEEKVENDIISVEIDEEQEQIETLVISSFYTLPDIHEKANAFQALNPHIRVVFDEAYDSHEDIDGLHFDTERDAYRENTKKLLEDETAEADIVEVLPEDVELLATKELTYDLYESIKKDGEFSLDDYYKSVIDVVTIEDRLVGFPLGFTNEYWSINQDVKETADSIKDKETITMDEIVEIYNKVEEEEYLISPSFSIYKANYLSTLERHLDKVDQSELEKQLESIKKGSLSDEELVEEVVIEGKSDEAKKKALFYAIDNARIAEFIPDISLFPEAHIRPSETFKGLVPLVNSQDELYVNISTIFGIHPNSEKKELAWAFIKFMIFEEVEQEENYHFNLHINKRINRNSIFQYFDDFLLGEDTIELSEEVEEEIGLVIGKIEKDIEMPMTSLQLQDTEERNKILKEYKEEEKTILEIVEQLEKQIGG